MHCTDTGSDCDLDDVRVMRLAIVRAIEEVSSSRLEEGEVKGL